MCPDVIIRRFAGFFVLGSVLLGATVSPWFYAFTAFVGFNLVQSSWTAFCPLEIMLGKTGWFGCRSRAQ